MSITNLHRFFTSPLPVRAGHNVAVAHLRSPVPRHGASSGPLSPCHGRNGGHCPVEGTNILGGCTFAGPLVSFLTRLQGRLTWGQKPTKTRMIQVRCATPRSNKIALVTADWNWEMLNLQILQVFPISSPLQSPVELSPVSKNPLPEMCIKHANRWHNRQHATCSQQMLNQNRIVIRGSVLLLTYHKSHWVQFRCFRRFLDETTISWLRVCL